MGEPAGSLKEFIQACQHVAMRAPVFRKRAALCIELTEEFVFGLNVSRQVRAAEAEDRLLGVPHDDETLLFAFHENAAENVPLQRIGVLKLIDDGIPIACAQPFKKDGGSLVVLL